MTTRRILRHYCALGFLAALVACGGGSPAQPSTPTNCSFTVGNEPVIAVGAVAGEFTVSIATASGCNWAATSSATFITPVNPATGSGNGSARFSVQANTGGGRLGQVRVADRTLDVVQASGIPEVCNYTVSPTDISVSSNGGDVSVTVISSNSCVWSATSNDGFITVKSGATGIGTGTVVLTIASGTSARTGTATIAGQAVTITQQASGAPPPSPGCAFSVSPLQVSVATAGGNIVIGVTQTLGTSCAWTVQTQSPFMTIVGGASRTGSTNVTVSVAHNPNALARSDTISIAGQTVTVFQSGTSGPISQGVAVLSYQSDPGDVVGAGASNTFTLRGAEFTATIDPASREMIFRMTPQPGGRPWLVRMEAPAGQTLSTGTYDHAELWPFQSASRPGLSVGGNGTSCSNRLTGRFLVGQAAFSSGVIDRFHARFEQHCNGESPGLRGEIWIDAQGGMPPPLAFPPTPSTPTTFLKFQTDPGFINGPLTVNHTLATAAFSGGTSNGTQVGAGAVGLSGPLERWAVIMAAPTGTQLTVGTYNNATKSNSTTAPGLDFSGIGAIGIGCNTLTGRFVVLELVYGTQGELERFHATFEQTCAGAPAGLKGEIRIVADPWR